MEKNNMRAVFEKSGRAVYISHLDLLRTMQRALKRAKIPVWYTQGFNPRIYLNFPLALSLGVSSRTEFMDFAVTENISFEKLTEMMNVSMPDGLRILSVAEPVHPNKDIGFAEYVIDFYSSAGSEKIFEELEKMMSMDVIETDKRSKSKGTVRIDIKPHLNIISTKKADEAFKVNIRLPAGLSLNINSNVFTDTFSAISGIKFDKIYTERTKILLTNGEKFI
ncbi:MAG: TIGR03936 family radical SAM-associated protein [Oscillospiraceae bacterium]|nr:TIGR03936 family radical SAM-associated protein [Oscillospiraceae bacterium]